MRVGFTGTRRGMTLDQAMQVNLEFAKTEAYELHHGGERHADAQMHNIALAYRCPITVHPSDMPDTQMAPRDLDHPLVTVLPAKPPLVRNQVIVDQVGWLLAAPHELEEVLRSGTWSTIRKALKAKVPVAIVYRDGKVEYHR